MGEGGKYCYFDYSVDSCIFSFNDVSAFCSAFTRLNDAFERWTLSMYLSLFRIQEKIETEDEMQFLHFYSNLKYKILRRWVLFAYFHKSKYKNNENANIFIIKVERCLEEIL